MENYIEVKKIHDMLESDILKCSAQKKLGVFCGLNCPND